MKLQDILTKAGKYKGRKRVGRGTGSGHGKTSGRGSKGAKSRSGWRNRLGYEGGQNPILKRMPKLGFNNYEFRTEYQVVNVADLEKKFEAGARVDAEALKKANLIGKTSEPVKVLGNGELLKKLTVVASKFSATAAEKIAKAGGTTETI